MLKAAGGTSPLSQTCVATRRCTRARRTPVLATTTSNLAISHTTIFFLLEAETRSSALSPLRSSRTKRQISHPPQTRFPYAASMNQLRWHVCTNGYGFLVSLYNSVDHLSSLTFYIKFRQTIPDRREKRLYIPYSFYNGL